MINRVLVGVCVWNRNILQPPSICVRVYASLLNFIVYMLSDLFVYCEMLTACVCNSAIKTNMVIILKMQEIEIVTKNCICCGKMFFEMNLITLIRLSGQVANRMIISILFSCKNPYYLLVLLQQWNLRHPIIANIIIINQLLLWWVFIARSEHIANRYVDGDNDNKINPVTYRNTDRRCWWFVCLRSRYR